jgi:hypothetical protein
MVLVTGQLLVDDGQNVLQYSQMFHVSQLDIEICITADR